MVRNRLSSIVACLIVIAGLGCQKAKLAGLTPGGAQTRKITVDEYVDKMKAGWIGQMAGVGWGGPTEFRFQGAIIPEANMPAWKPSMINQFQQDDIYVEMTFLRTLELHGFDVSIRQAGIDFANSGYPLWHANRAGRENLRTGIAPPDSGHPKFNKHADDIDYQIEADYAGLIAPGMPNVAIALGEKFGRLMNYGDGLYGGQFVAGMYTEAFFNDNIIEIIEAGLACIPKDSQYHECITDVLGWHKEYPQDWTKTWQLINEKYHVSPDRRLFSCSGPDSDFNIDAKINGAYIVMGLLYGDRDPVKTIVISTRCGQDSDCNPSNAAGVLFTSMGFKALPETYKIALDPMGKFSHTPYDFPTLVRVCEDLARDAVVNCGGKIENDDNGNEVFVIPQRAPRPSALERSWDPGPATGSRYTEKEMAQITALLGKDLSKAIARFAPGWSIARCGEDMDPGLREMLRGRANVLVTHPLNPETACIISRTVELPARKKTVLKLEVGHDPRGDWDLVVKVNGEELLTKTISSETANLGWTEAEVDLSRYAGKSAKIELLNKPTDWRFEAGYWARIALESE